MLGYQNVPGDADLDALFNHWHKEGFSFPLVVFRYAIEQSSGGDRVSFSRVPYPRNGICPSSSFGKALNASRGISVSVENTKFERDRFHKANDQALASYAAVLWWHRYAIHYLSEEQKVEMAAGGRLTTPLVVAANQLDQVPSLTGVDVPLTASDIIRALAFLNEAGLVVYKSRKRLFEVNLRDDKHIRPLRGASEAVGRQDIATKIIWRWARSRVLRPDRQPRVPKRPRSAGRRAKKDTFSLSFQFP